MVKIVVIDDEAFALDEMITWLQVEDYEVRGAENGQLGLELIRQEIPDLIICDVVMPEMDGHEVLIELRADRKLSLIPFIFLTVAGDHDSVRKGMNLGADDYLTKPINREDVLNAIQSRLKKKAAEEAQIKALVSILDMAFTEEREKRLLKSRMVAMFSHDFRTSLASILSASYIIRNFENRLSQGQKEQYLDRVDGAVHMLIQMLDDMMTVAELENGQLEYTPQLMNLSSFVEAIAEEFRLIDEDAHKLTVHATLQSWVEADPKLVRQIVTNLISNAIKYSPSETEITIILSTDDSRINLSVQDQGIGIPEEALAHLFEPFYRARNVKNLKGTGLGLSIVNDCVERHNGRIEVVSQVGEGTTFLVKLPLIVR